MLEKRVNKLREEEKSKKDELAEIIGIRNCYEAKEQQDAKKREEYWREEEENSR